MKINPYLNFAGNSEEAFNFYKSVFGGEFLAAVRFKDMPMEGMEIPEDEAGGMMHIALPMTESNTLMASDVLPSQGHELVQGNNVYISIHPDSREEADRIFNNLAEGATVEMPMGDQMWGDYYGSLKDKFGIHWMINYSPPREGQS